MACITKKRDNSYQRDLSFSLYCALNFIWGGGDLSSTFNLFKKKKQIFVIEKIMIIELRASRVKVWGYFTILVKYQLHM